MADAKTTETKTEKAPKFVAPPKPAVAPTSLDKADYGYTDDKGKFRFWQGYDAKYKGVLMATSRALPANGPTARKARRILVEHGWSTEDAEVAAVKVAQDKAKAAVDREKAKVAKAKEKAAAKKAKPSPKETEPETPVTETETEVSEPAVA